MAGGAAGLVEEPGGRERRYAAASSPTGGRAEMHGVGDGRPLDCPAGGGGRSRFLLDRYHLLEHLHEAALALTPGGAAPRVGCVSR